MMNRVCWLYSIILVMLFICYLLVDQDSDLDFAR